MTTESEIRPRIGPVAEGDLRAIRQVLDEGKLPHEDITPEHLAFFLGAWVDGSLVGVVGLEPFGSIGLVRSLAVTVPQRERGIASDLLRRIEEAAVKAGVSTLYGLTETIEDLLLRRGYARIDRSGAPAEIRETPEFAGLCPESAALLVKKL